MKRTLSLLLALSLGGCYSINYFSAEECYFTILQYKPRSQYRVETYSYNADNGSVTFQHGTKVMELKAKQYIIFEECTEQTDIPEPSKELI